MSNRGARTLGLLVALAALISAIPATAREKTDVVTLTNGDRITGEIRQLDVGILTVKTDHMGTVAIEWIAVDSVESDQSFEVTDQNGET